jgi:acyl-CoA synthetase (AMP-forming)/AMP-acid ligase II
MARAPWSEWTLVHLIRRQAAELGDRPFVRVEDGQSFTFRALDARTDEVASSLSSADPAG